MTALRVLSYADVVKLLPMHECIAVVERALVTTARGGAVNPLRMAVWQPDRSGLIGVMPGVLDEPKSLGIKVVTIFPGNHGTGRDSHQGVVMLFDTTHGEPLVVIDAASITAIRTAAASAVATRALARPDAGDLAIFGSGVQAATHLEAMRAVRRLRRVRVWSRNREHARAFAAQHPSMDAVELVATAREAALGADILCTCTAAREPVLEGAWLSPGAHVNAVGACFASARELDTAAVARARLIVDRTESALNEAGDFLIPKREGAFGDDHIAGELGEVLLGRVPGRRAPDEITLFKSLGIAIEDLAAAHHVYERAIATNTGTIVTL